MHVNANRGKREASNSVNWNGWADWGTRWVGGVAMLFPFFSCDFCHSSLDLWI